MQDENSNLEFTHISQLFRKPDLTVNQLTERVIDMASARFKSEFDSFKTAVESKLDSTKESQDTMIDAQNAKYNVLIWATGLLDW
ncbi:MAG: hypothetical protein OXF06_10990 [Bacteroidetes bacterium]|nr:hypothetical protein [Bacteroidota bacterium]